MAEMKKQDYVVRVFNPLGDCWLSEQSDEDAPDFLPTTSDPVLIARYTDFVEARNVLRKMVKRHPANSFKLDVMARDNGR